MMKKAIPGWFLTLQKRYRIHTFIDCSKVSRASELGKYVTAHRQVTHAKLIKCRVIVKTEDSKRSYDGLFKSTSKATLDVTKRIGVYPCKIYAKALP